MIRSELDVLLEKVPDDALRAELRTQIDRLKQRRSFGLVFERHIPERVRLPQHPIRVGSQVVSRDDDDNPTWEVVAIDDGVATLEPVRDTDGAYLQRGEHGAVEQEQAPLDSLVVISDFGEPVLPGFRHLGSVERGGDKPFHTVINGENYHALETLLFTHGGKVDCIYIDPPYNTGARDWKYNNDYVDDDDAYRHSKWLAFMERRLMLAKELLNPDDSVLIVTIDEKEYLRLGLLLEQTFPGARIQMVSITINPAGAGSCERVLSRRRVRVLRHVLGGAACHAPHLPERAMRRRGAMALLFGARDDRVGSRNQADGPNQFYPIYVDAIATGADRRGRRRHRAPMTTGTAMPAATGSRGRVPSSKHDGTRDELGHLTGTEPPEGTGRRVRSRRRPATSSSRYAIAYLTQPDDQTSRERRARSSSGRDPTASMIVDDSRRQGDRTPTTVWTRRCPQRWQQYGTDAASRAAARSAASRSRSRSTRSRTRSASSSRTSRTPSSSTSSPAPARPPTRSCDSTGRTAVDASRSWSRTTRCRPTRRRSSASEGLRPGDPEWEALGIFEHITRPRMTAAITGKTPDGEPIKGDYKFTDEFPMADGFEENVEFLELRYLDADDVDLGLAFDDIAPLLWLRAGGQGPIARRVDDAGDAAPVRLDRAATASCSTRTAGAASCRPGRRRATTAFIVTYSPTVFAGDRRRAARRRWTPSACTTRTCRCSCPSAGAPDALRAARLPARRGPRRAQATSAWPPRLARGRRALVVRAVGHHRVRQDRHRDRGHRGAAVRLDRPRHRPRSARLVPVDHGRPGAQPPDPRPDARRVGAAGADDARRRSTSRSWTPTSRPAGSTS